ncbi:MAG: hypothetical protein ACRCTP_17855 [Aeromonas popoffii]|uniref:hypothetical protein n=1 Tax=Aeromonas popoffii TaxID=70856 RepID=UPI003F3BF847
MKVELKKTKCIRPFDIVHPATCFIPDLGPAALPEHRNVWIKLAAPHHKKAVNLATGDLLRIDDGVACETVDAKVVVE